ncbi:hypothetical protein [Sporosarcina sp. G11-34]|uniref:hypothetical protein n=1 Tax=Sporosarcina sp. G11-34 TaxID=2849605 RepID=UPI0022A9EE51|nr:hypothetical protein [Sporosarcina sp. G11-34]
MNLLKKSYINKLKYGFTLIPEKELTFRPLKWRLIVKGLTFQAKEWRILAVGLTPQKVDKLIIPTTNNYSALEIAQGCVFLFER